MSFKSILLSLGITLALSVTALPVWSQTSLQPEENASAILSVLADSLQFGRPVILDVRCGEWTPALERELRKLLLNKQADVRELNLGLLEEPAKLDTSSVADVGQLLKSLNLQTADLLELTLEQSVETGERRNLFSYSRYSMPVYHFVLKQVALPEHKLTTLKEFKLKGEPEVENPGSLLAMKWYEPILASAILGSLIYMLWTLK